MIHFLRSLARWQVAGLFLTLLSCKRLDGDTVCEGTVVDRTTTARVANATVAVYQRGSSGGGLGGGYVLKEQHEADASGNFAFHIGSEADDMILRAFSAQGYETIWQEAIYLRGGRNNKKLVLKAQAPAWVKVRFRDVAPLDSAAVSVGGSLPQSGFYSWYSRDTSIVYPVQGNYNAFVYWEVLTVHGNPNAPIRTGSQSVYVSSLDTASVEITY